MYSILHEFHKLGLLSLSFYDLHSRENYQHNQHLLKKTAHIVNNLHSVRSRSLVNFF